MGFTSLLSYGVFSQFKADSAFSPDQIDGLAAWYGDDVNGGTDRTTLADGTAITQWDDLSGNDYDLTVYGTDNEPTYNTVETGINFSVSAAASLYYNGIVLYNNGNTVFTVYKVDNPSSTACLWFHGNDNDTGKSEEFLLVQGGLGIENAFATSNGSNRTQYWSSDAAGDYGWVNGDSIINVNIYPDNESGNAEFRINGAAATKTLNQTGTFIIEAPFHVGRARYTSPRYFEGVIKEIVAYNRALTTEEIEQVEDYLTKKYLWNGLTMYMPLDETSGTDVYDEVNSYDGTMVDATIRTASGKNNYGMLTPANDDNDHRIHFSSKWGITSHPLSFSFWFKKGASWTSSDVGSLFHIGNTEQSSGRGILCYSYNNLLNVNCYNSSGLRYTTQWNNPFTTSNWYHVVITINAYNDLTMYLNGVEFTISYSDGNGGDGIDWSQNQSTLFGYINAYPTANQYVDEFGVWDRLLSQPEAATLYNSGEGKFYERDLWDGLVSYWTFDEESGTIANDIYGSHDGTADTNVLDSSTGMNNSCANFTGGNYIIDFGDHSDFYIGSNGFTWSCWSKRTTINASALITKGYSNGTSSNDDYNNMPWYLSRTSSENAEFFLRLTDGTNLLVVSTTVVNDGVWHHIAATVDTTNGILTLYVDGQEDGQLTNSEINTGNFGNNTSPLIIGSHFEYINAYVDETALWQRALTPTEISELYNNGAGKFYGSEDPTITISAPTNLSYSNVGGTSADLSWTVNSDGGSQIIEQLNGSTWTTFDTIADYSTNTYTITGLDVITEYTFRVTSTDGTTSASSDSVTFTTTSESFIEATGGAVTTDGDYKVHTFTSNGTFSVTQVGSTGNDSVEYLIVAGGGAGGDTSSTVSTIVYVAGGAGGAGGMLEGTETVNTGDYTVNVGSGGDSYGMGGSSSSALGYTATGGGGGSNSSDSGVSTDAVAGGSGGGGGAVESSQVDSSTGAAGISGQGNNGAAGNTTTNVAGGGGGKSSAASGEVGGSGKSSSISGSAVTYATGGSARTSAGSGASGAANTGNGGDGSRTENENVSRTGGSGGSGIVIIRYKFQ